ncbi:MAG: tRNA pseudouridine(38-40) synthase TruA [Mucinivorans sp.]
MRYFIHLAYKGTAYHGWQNQPNAVTVQQVLEGALSKILRTQAMVVGCGRTDAGVHSSSYYAHFEYVGERELNKEFISHLNSCLPRDIAIFEIYPTDLHARFDATRREYKYFIAREKDPFRTDERWLLTTPLLKEEMQVAASKLLEYSDFASFAKTKSDNKTTICKIERADWEFTEKNYIFTIVADRFLRGMVRAVVGTLVDVGRGRISVEQFEQIIEAHDRNRASSAAVPGGLFLTDIKY